MKNIITGETAEANADPLGCFKVGQATLGVHSAAKRGIDVALVTSS